VERAPVLVAAAVSDQAVQSVDALTREKTPQQDDKSQALPRSQASDTADVVTLDLQAADAAAQADGTPVQMQDYANRPRVAVSSAVSTVFSAEISGWQNALRRELARCATRGFFERPACSWNARKRYCEPNRAWGTVSECPPKPD
jgi:vancomycin resistance protein YoaR